MKANLKSLTPTERKVRNDWIVILDIIFDIAEQEGYSLPDLAAKAGISTSTVYRYYHEQFVWMRSDCLGKLMRAVGIDFANFIEAGVSVPFARDRAA